MAKTIAKLCIRSQCYSALVDPAKAMPVFATRFVFEDVPVTSRLVTGVSKSPIVKPRLIWRFAGMV